MMKRILMLLLAASLLLALSAPALAGHGVYHVDYTDEAPDKVMNSLESRWQGYVLEDYVFLDGPSPDVGLALVEKDGHRVLAAYRKSSGEMAFWYSTDKAIPQGDGEAWFEKTDNKSFTVVRYDLLGDFYNQQVGYRWGDGSFQLKHFSDLDQTNENAVVEADGLAYYWERSLQGRVTGEVQKDIRHVNFEKLPKTLAAAENSVTSAPDDLPIGRILCRDGGNLVAKEIKFSGGRNHAVYLGPGEHYMRSGNGKGTVSTNDWIQVFGRYNNWIMIQYDISAERYRIGWIPASALPSGASVPNIDMRMLDNEDYGEVLEKCVLTDDPFNSESPIATLKPGTPICEIVYNMGGWSYVRVTIDGKDVCGFVPTDCITHG